jgi:hypothetical protein
MATINPKLDEALERETKERFAMAGRHASGGELEAMRERIDKLEDAVAHLVAFIAGRLRLTEDEIQNENGLADF